MAHGLLNQSQQAYYSGDNFGGYQFISLEEIINNFMATYVGEDKILPRTKRGDVTFHAMRAMQELSFDTLKSCKSQEITVPASLQMILPQDYVNYTKVSWVDSAGIKHILYPTSKTSNPSSVPLQDSAGDYSLIATGTLVNGDATITLDAEYGNIKVGMIVSGPNIVAGSEVLATSNSSSITTIEINNDATYTGTENLTFTNADGSLVLKEQSTHILENVAWDANEDKITQAPNTGVSSVTVGMLVSHEDFPIGTTVIDVNGAVITTSANSTAASTATTNEVTFISTPGDSTAWSNYKSTTPSENQDDYQDDTYWPMDGSRFGLDPQHAQANGSFYIDCSSGKIHFSSNISGKTVILDYISDGLGTHAEMVVHKFAEEAMYKWIIYGCISAKIDIPEYVINRFKKEKFAETRKAKLRLSNIKLEEITQILRGKSKQIKH